MLQLWFSKKQGVRDLFLCIIALQPLLRYSPCLLIIIASLLLSSHFYPIDTTDFGCFPCRCWQKEDGTKHLASCGLVGIFRLKDLSLSAQSITSVAEDAFKFSKGLHRLSLSGNELFFLPTNMFARLDSLQLLDLGRLGYNMLNLIHLQAYRI